MSSNKHFETDIVIIGAGPVGLFSVFEAGMLKMKCHVIDSLEHIGGQCSALYPEKPIYDIPAHPKISGADLISKLEEQITPFSPTFHLNQQVNKIQKIEHENDKSSFNIEVTTSLNNVIKAKALIIAAGCGAFGPNKPPLNDIEKYEGKSIFYSIRKMDDFKGKKIAIAGGGDSAVDWALSLSDVASQVYVIHRRDKFRAAPDNIDKLKSLDGKGVVEFIIPYQLDGLVGNNDHLSKVIVKDLQGNIKELDAEILLPFFGLAMELGPIASWGLNLEKNHITVDPFTMQTSEKHIYAIGDIATYKNKLKLILAGFSEAATVCHDIYNIVYPDTPLHFEYSTTSGVGSK